MWSLFVGNPLNLSGPGSKWIRLYNMEVSQNRGTPKSSILVGFSIINHLIWGTSISGNLHIGQWLCLKKRWIHRQCMAGSQGTWMTHWGFAIAPAGDVALDEGPTAQASENDLGIPLTQFCFAYIVKTTRSNIFRFAYRTFGQTSDLADQWNILDSIFDPFLWRILRLPLPLFLVTRPRCSVISVLSEVV